MYQGGHGRAERAPASRSTAVMMQLLPCVVLAGAHDAFTDEAAGLPLVELVFR